MASGHMAQFLERRTADQQVLGSNPDVPLLVLLVMMGGAPNHTDTPVAPKMCWRNHPCLPRGKMVPGEKRHRGDLSPCGQSPMDFESITLTTRSQCQMKCQRRVAIPLFMRACAEQHE